MLLDSRLSSEGWPGHWLGETLFGSLASLPRAEECIARKLATGTGPSEMFRGLENGSLVVIALPSAIQFIVVL